MTGTSVPSLRVAVLTVSDAGSRGERVDTSGPSIVQWAEARGAVVTATRLVPDETVDIARALTEWSDADQADLILTTGGTGLAPRDVTPEATRAVLDREADGIAEAIRAASGPKFPRAALSRGLAGVRGRTLVVNLPGSPGGVRDGLAVLDQFIDHAVDLIRDRPHAHEPS